MVSSFILRVPRKNNSKTLEIKLNLKAFCARLRVHRLQIWTRFKAAFGEIFAHDFHGDRTPVDCRRPPSVCWPQNYSILSLSDRFRRLNYTHTQTYIRHGRWHRQSKIVHLECDFLIRSGRKMCRAKFIFMTSYIYIYVFIRWMCICVDCSDYMYKYIPTNTHSCVIVSVCLWYSSMCVLTQKLRKAILTPNTSIHPQ